MTKPLIEVYARKDCSICSCPKGCVLCNDVKDTLGRVGAEIPFQFKEVDIDASDDLFRRFNSDIPTVFINGKKAFKFKVDENEFRKKLRKEIIKAKLLSLRNQKAAT
ncbi:MAG: glutaredoxin family protein [Deltaproteobacteria bacterium]|nr:glutaredoxin family protein [Deltaproteobacteria bacterium]